MVMKPVSVNQEQTEGYSCVSHAVCLDYSTEYLNSVFVWEG